MRAHRLLILLTVLLQGGCAGNPCSLLYDERTELERFIQEPGYARKHIRYPLRYVEIRDGEVVLDTRLEEAELLARHDAIRRDRALSDYHQRVTVPLQTADGYELRAGNADHPATDIYILEAGLCRISLVEYRHYL